MTLIECFGSNGFEGDGAIVSRQKKNGATLKRLRQVLQTGLNAICS
jgi:hypothetical protein